MIDEYRPKPKLKLHESERDESDVTTQLKTYFREQGCRF